MRIAKDELAKLVTLQEYDRVIDALLAVLADVPKQVAALQAESAAEKAALAEVKDRHTQLLLRRKEKELDLGKKEEEIKKHNIELNSVKTNEAFRAMQSQIDRCKGEASAIETEILVFMEESDAFLREEKEKSTALKAAEIRIAEKIKVLEGQKAESEGKLAAERAKRDAFAAAIPGELLGHYDNVRRRRGGVAMARLEGETCTVCRMNQPPQSKVNLAKGHEIVACESCQRILYPSELAAAKPA
ncbi:MAG TPA: hypothetical protein DCM05_13360 [Elusimicrobia bacterium]|nr:hypothetical protein [Elusimicrobiota bacterium]